MEFSPQLAIGLAGTGSIQAAGLDNRVLAEPPHLVHIAQYAAALRPRQPHARVEHAESVQREVLSFELMADEGDDGGADRDQIGLAEVRNKDREQGAGMARRRDFRSASEIRLAYQSWSAGSAVAKSRGRAPRSLSVLAVHRSTTRPWHRDRDSNPELCG